MNLLLVLLEILLKGVQLLDNQLIILWSTSYPDYSRRHKRTQSHWEQEILIKYGRKWYWCLLIMDMMHWIVMKPNQSCIKSDLNMEDKSMMKSIQMEFPLVLKSKLRMESHIRVDSLCILVDMLETLHVI